MVSDFGEFLSIAGQITAYIIALILIAQILRALFGGTWEIENIILAIVIFNLTVSFGIGGYLLHLNNKVSKVDKKMYGHIEWHRGRDSKK